MSRLVSLALPALTRPPTALPHLAVSADQQQAVREAQSDTVLGMLVADLYHFLDLPEDTGPSTPSGGIPTQHRPGGNVGDAAPSG
jgi:hypothetical protein